MCEGTHCLCTLTMCEVYVHKHMCEGTYPQQCVRVHKQCVRVHKQCVRVHK